MGPKNMFFVFQMNEKKNARWTTLLQFVNMLVLACERRVLIFLKLANVPIAC